MKFKKITLLSCGALFFVAASQLISCGGNKPKPTIYSVAMNSASLKVNDTTAESGKDFTTKISLTTTDDVHILPHSLSVKIADQEVANDKYTYTASGEDAGKFSISAANLTGNVVITAEADKITKSVGDYAHLFVAGESVEFEIANVEVGSYIINAITDNGAYLDRYYYSSDGTKTMINEPIFKVTEARSYKIGFKRNSDVEPIINENVTAAIIKIVEIGADSDYARFNLSKDYNKKGVAFQYKLPFNTTSTNFAITPIIVDGAKYFADSPKDLAKLLPSPTIYNSNFAKTSLTKIKGTEISCFIGEKEIKKESDPYLMLGYFDNIPNDGASFEVSSYTNKKLTFEVEHDSSHNIYAELNTSVDALVYAYNDKNIDLKAAYALYNNSFDVLTMQGRNTFTTRSNSSILCYNVAKGVTLSGYNVGDYCDEVDEGNITLTANKYKNKDYIFGAHSTGTTENPIATIDTTTNKQYSFVVSITSTSESIVKENTKVMAFLSEKGPGGETVKPFELSLIAKETVNGKHINYYSLHDVSINYHTADDNIDSANLIKLIISFNDSVTDGDKINISGKHPISVSYNSGSYVARSCPGLALGQYNAFAGVPYAYVLTVENKYLPLIKENITLKNGETETDFNFENNIFSFKPQAYTDKFKVQVTPIENYATLNLGDTEQTAYFEFQGKVDSIKINAVSETNVVIIPKAGYKIDVTGTPSHNDFVAKGPSSASHQYTIRPSNMSLDELGGTIRLTYSGLDGTDCQKTYSFHDSIDSINNKYFKTI